jgi:hypothetical protein
MFMRQAISLLSLLFFAPLLVADPPVQADFVVATSGSDESPGTAAKPFATLTRARDEVRKLNAGGPPRRTVTVLVRGGTYVLKETLVFGPEDSGTAQRHNVYAAYPDETPVLSSGREISGWKQGPGKCWVAQVSAARGGAWRFTQLFVNGKRQTRARLPDTDDWNKWWRVAPGPNHPAVFHLPKGTLKNWSTASDLEINLIPQYYWQNQIIALKTVDEKTYTATLAVPTPAYAICPGNPFRAENVPEGVTRPGTWSLDTRSAVATLWPARGVDLARSVVTAPALPLLLRCQGTEEGGRLVRGLTFRGFTFTQTAQVPLSQRDPKDTGTLDTNDCAVLLEGAEDCMVEDCRFVDTGGYGVRLRHTSRRNRITGNEFVGCGGGGVLLTGYGPGTRDVNRGNIIADNHIHHCGVFFWHACGISGTQSGENFIAFNHLHDMPYGGILFADCSVDYFKEFRGKQGRGFQFRWEEIGDDPLTFQSVKRFTHSRKNQIAYNTIHHVMQRLHDGGGIHLGFVGGQNVVRGNLIHGVRGTGSGWGLYADAETNRERVEANVVWDCDAPKIDYEHGGRNNNKWVGNVLSRERDEPPQAERLRATIAAKRKKELNPPDVTQAVQPERPDYQIGPREPGAP